MISGVEGNVNVYNNNPVAYGFLPATENLLPMYGSAIADCLPAKNAIKSDSGLTYALPVSRKRSRDCLNPLLTFPNGQLQRQNNISRCGSFTFLGEDISLQIQQQQLEIDRFIAQHTEKVKLEIEERRKRYSRSIVEAVEEAIVKRLRAKEEEIEKIGKMNWALEEKVKSLCVENQIWRDLAQTKEATANALRSNLEQILAQHHHGVCALEEAADLIDDAQSCCGSNYGGAEEERRTLAGCGGEIVAGKDKRDDDFGRSRSSSNSLRLCRHCGKEESSVLLLPCSHLCLCTVCGSSVHTCPICNTPKTTSVHVIVPS
ncbi:probable BOI-related E3 ubiquitin-protein ligase 3 isoform X2 [Diospyros lotus]|nr:probable BOI-related E3 ubiquitin-protein ligase 3 isoform X2 [Diospyros lotus]